jgi:tetratricopeptide (TPR) repeat protein
MDIYALSSWLLDEYWAHDTLLAVHMKSDEPDTYTWLLTIRDACPACGAPLALDAPACAACGRSFMTLVQPAGRSVAARTLIGLWTFGTLGMVLALIGTLFQLLGVTPQTNSSTVLRWLLIGSVATGSFSALMAWACWGRRPFALYVGITLAALLGLAGVAVGLLFRGTIGLGLATAGILAAIILIMTHISALPEFRGELRRQVFASSATSGKGLYREGRAHYAAGLRFLAAQRWARAIGKEPSNVAYMHALGLVLAQLGHHDRALSQLDRARQLDPNDSEIRKSYETVYRVVNSTS